MRKPPSMAVRRYVGYRSAFATHRRKFIAAKPGTPERRHLARMLVAASANMIGWASRCECGKVAGDGG